MATFKTALLTIAALLVSAASFADPLTCNLSEYKGSSGLNAAVANDTLTLTWDGDKEQELRLRFGVTAGTPTIRELALRRKGGQWATLLTNATPDFRVATGLRRATDQQSEGACPEWCCRGAFMRIGGAAARF